MRLSAEKLGRQLAKENAEDTRGWSSDEFVEYFFDAAGWKTVLRASWRGGSFAGIEQWGEYFHSYDDVRRYGPYRSFRSSRRKLQIDAGHDELIQRLVAPQFALDDKER
jgi:hypothetical protein